VALTILAVAFVPARAFGADANAVAIVTASKDSELAARSLSTQLDLPTVRRPTENARHLDRLVVEARTKWHEDLVVVVDAEQATVSVLRPSDGTIGSRTLGESASRAPYAVALAAVELLEIVRNAPPAHSPPSESAPPRRSLVLRMSFDFGLVQSVGTSGNLGLLEPTAGADLMLARPASPGFLLAGVHATGLVPTQRDLTLVLPSGDSRGRVDYLRDELSARFGIGHRQGPSAVFGWGDVGVAFIHIRARDLDGSFSSEDRRAAIWLGVGAELRYTVIAGLALGIGAGVAFLPVPSRFFASPPGSATALTALQEDGVELRARASVIWEFEP